MKYIPLAFGALLLIIMALVIFSPPAVGWQSTQRPAYSQYTYPGTKVPWTAPKPIVSQPNWRPAPKQQIRCTSTTLGATTTTTCR